MDEVIRRALAPVLRDLETSGITGPRIEASAWADDPDRPSVMLWDADGSGMGARVSRLARMCEQVASVADQVQEWAIEHLWGHAPTNWPPCPRHPTTHPMQAEDRDDSAVWVCPVDRTPMSVIGAIIAPPTGGTGSRVPSGR